MNTLTEKQQLFTAVTPALSRWIDGFLIAKRAEGLAQGTITKIYTPRLHYFADFCEQRNVTTLDSIDPTLLREYLLHLAEGHNAGGCHQFYRVLKTFLRWYEVEGAPDGWRNPIKRVPPPKVPEEILEPIDLADVSRLVAACGGDRVGGRDKAILLTLLDTGARASELTAFDVADFDMVTGALELVRFTCTALNH